MPVTVDTPLGVADLATLMTVVGKHKPREGEREEGRMAGREDGREGKEGRSMPGRQRRGGKWISQSWVITN